MTTWNPECLKCFVTSHENCPQLVHNVCLGASLYLGLLKTCCTKYSYYSLKLSSTLDLWCEVVPQKLECIERSLFRHSTVGKFHMYNICKEDAWSMESQKCAYGYCFMNLVLSPSRSASKRSDCVRLQPAVIFFEEDFSLHVWFFGGYALQLALFMHKEALRTRLFCSYVIPLISPWQWDSRARYHLPDQCHMPHCVVFL